VHSSVSAEDNFQVTPDGGRVIVALVSVQIEGIVGRRVSHPLFRVKIGHAALHAILVASPTCVFPVVAELALEGLLNLRRSSPGSPRSKFLVSSFD
jgi:hypothetical protein